MKKVRQIGDLLKDTGEPDSDLGTFSPKPIL